MKPGWKLEYIEQTSSNTMRIVDAHSSIQFLQDFLLTRTNSARRQIVIVAHYPITSDRIDDEERKRFCKLIHDAQNATGDFEAAGEKLSPTWPILAYLHGHTHSQPNHHDWTCPSPYAAVTIPQFSVGTPLYGGTENAPGQLHFTIVRIGSTKLEVVGVSAPAASPTGAWTYVYKERLSYPLEP